MGRAAKTAPVAKDKPQTLRRYWGELQARHGDKDGKVPREVGLIFKANLNRLFGAEQIARMGHDGVLERLSDEEIRKNTHARQVPKWDDLEPEFGPGSQPRPPPLNQQSGIGQTIRRISPIAGDDGTPMDDPRNLVADVRMSDGSYLSTKSASTNVFPPTHVVNPTGAEGAGELVSPRTAELDRMTQGRGERPVPEVEPEEEKALGPGLEVVKRGVEPTTVARPERKHVQGDEYLRDHDTPRMDPADTPDVSPDEYERVKNDPPVPGEEGELGEQDNAEPDFPVTRTPNAVIPASNPFEKGWGALSDAFSDMGGEIVDAAKEVPGIIKQTPKALAEYAVRVGPKNAAMVFGGTVGFVDDVVYKPFWNFVDAARIDLQGGTIDDLKAKLAQLEEDERNGITNTQVARGKVDHLLRKALDIRAELRHDIAGKQIRTLEHMSNMEAEMTERYETAGAMPALLGFLENTARDAGNILQGLGDLFLAEIPGFKESLYEKGATSATDYVMRSMETGWSRGLDFTGGMGAAVMAVFANPVKAIQTMPVTTGMTLLPVAKLAHFKAGATLAAAKAAAKSGTGPTGAKGAAVKAATKALEGAVVVLKYAEMAAKVMDLGITPGLGAAPRVISKGVGGTVRGLGDATGALPENVRAGVSDAANWARRWLAESLEIPTREARDYAAKIVMKQQEVKAIVYNLSQVLSRTVEAGDYVPPEGPSLMSSSRKEGATSLDKRRKTETPVERQWADEGLIPDPDIIPDAKGPGGRPKTKTFGPGEHPPLKDYKWADGRFMTEKEVGLVSRRMEDAWNDHLDSKPEVRELPPDAFKNAHADFSAQFYQEGLARSGNAYDLRAPGPPGPSREPGLPPDLEGPWIDLSTQRKALGEDGAPPPKAQPGFEEGRPLPDEPGETIQALPDDLPPEAPVDPSMERLRQLDMDRRAREHEPGPYQFPVDRPPRWTPQLENATRDRFGIYEHEFREYAEFVEAHLEKTYPDQGVKFTEATPGRDLSLASIDYFKREGGSAVMASIKGKQYPMSAPDMVEFITNVTHFINEDMASQNKAEYRALAIHLNQTGTVSPSNGMRWTADQTSLRLGILDETVDAGGAPMRRPSELGNAKAMAELANDMDARYPPTPEYVESTMSDVSRAEQLAIRFAEEGENASALGEMVATVEQLTKTTIDDGRVDPGLTPKTGEVLLVEEPKGGWYDPETFGVNEGTPTQSGQTTLSFERPARFGKEAAEAINSAAKALNVPAKLLAAHFLDALDHNTSGKVLNSKILRDNLKVNFEAWLDHHNVPKGERKILRASLKDQASALAKGEYLDTNKSIRLEVPAHRWLSDPSTPKKPGVPNAKTNLHRTTETKRFHILPQAVKVLEQGGDWARSVVEAVADTVASDIFHMPTSVKNKALSAAIMKMGFDLAESLSGSAVRKQAFESVMKSPDRPDVALQRAIDSIDGGGDGAPAVMTVSPTDVGARLIGGMKNTWTEGGAVKHLTTGGFGATVSAGMKAALVRVFDPKKWVEMDPLLLAAMEFSPERLGKLLKHDKKGSATRKIWMRKPLHEALMAEHNVAQALNKVGWIDKLVRSNKRGLVALSVGTVVGNLMSDYVISVINEGNPDVWRKVNRVDNLLRDYEKGFLTKDNNPVMHHKITMLIRTSLLEGTALDVELGHQVHQGVMDMPIFDYLFGGPENTHGRYAKFKDLLEKQGNEPLLRLFRRGTNSFKAYNALKAWDRMEAAAEGHLVGETFTMFPIAVRPTVFVRVPDIRGVATFAVESTGRVLTPAQWDMALARSSKVTSDRMFADYNRSGLLTKKLRTSPVLNLTFASMFSLYFLHSMHIPGIKKGVASNMFDPNPAFIPTNKAVKGQFAERLVGTNMRAGLMAAGANANEIHAADWLRKIGGYRRREDAWAALQLTLNPHVVDYWSLSNLDVFQSTRLIVSTIQSGLIQGTAMAVNLFDESPDNELNILYPDGGGGGNLEYKLESFTNPAEKDWVKKMRWWKNEDLTGGVFTFEDAMSLVYLGGGPVLDLIGDLLHAGKHQLPMDWTATAGKFTNGMIGATAGRLVHVGVAYADPTSSFSNLRFVVKDKDIFARGTLTEQDAVKIKWAIRQVTMKGFQSVNIKEKGLKRYVKQWSLAWSKAMIKPVSDELEMLKRSKDPEDRKRLVVVRKNKRTLDRLLKEEKREMIILWRQYSAVIRQMTDQAQKGPLRVTPTLKQRQMLKGDKNPGPRANEEQMKEMHDDQEIWKWSNQSKMSPYWNDVAKDKAVRKKAGRQKNRASALQRRLQELNEEKTEE